MSINLPKSVHCSQWTANREKIFVNRELKGFTLVELVVAIGILTVLFAIALIAINPARQFAQANNTQRRSDVGAILNAIHQYAADKNGALPAGIPTSPASPAEISDGGANLCASLTPTYIADLPLDPSDGSKTDPDCLAGSYNTKYTVVKNTSGRVTVKATGQDEGDGTFDISVTR